MNWIVKRTLVLFLTLAATISINFFLIRLMPGNPVDILIRDYMLMGYSYEEAVNAVAAIVPFVPDKPIHEQFIDYLKGILRGDLGKSITLATPVTVILGYGIPWTVFIVSISLLTSFSLGVVLGIYAAYRRGGILDKGLSMFASVSGALPAYVIGVLFVLAFAVQLDWFPAYGTFGTLPGNPSAHVKPGFTLDFIVSVFYHAALPLLTYVTTTIGGWLLAMKSSTISALGEYYVTAAEARGLPERRIVLTYVGRNAVLPLFARLAISLGYMFGGVVFIETIFSYRGIGSFLSHAIGVRDHTLMSGVFIVISIAVVASNFAADLLYSRLDPRIRLAAD